jgi:hypothetical protein
MSFYAFTALSALIGAVASMIIGFVWYGPLFGKKWMEVIGVSPAAAQKVSQKEMIPEYVTNFVVAFIQFYALGFFAAFIGGLTVPGALLYGLFVWFGFTMPVQVGNALWSGKPKKLAWTMFGLTAGYQLLSILVGAVAWALLYATIA